MLKRIVPCAVAAVLGQVWAGACADARPPLEPGQIAANIANSYVGLHMGVPANPDPSAPTWDEWWCADFVKYVWDKAGANTDDLTAAANSFVYGYAPSMHTVPRVGDAMLVVVGDKWQDPDPEDIGHVALVTAVKGHEVTSVGGDEGNGTWSENIVKRQTTESAPGSVFEFAKYYGEWQNLYVLGYVSPIFNRIPGPDSDRVHY